MQQAVIGIDIGGTNIKAGVVTLKGELIVDRTLPTYSENGKEALLNKIEEIATSCLEEALYSNLDILALGIGTAGFINLEGEIGSATANLPDWKGTPLRAELEKRIGISVYVDNDVNMLALGELWQGAGKDLDHFLCVSLGTGIGGCLILNGLPYRGRSGFAGAYGHQVIQMKGVSCTCGSAGCWEQYASVTALKRQAAEAGETAWAEHPRLIFDEVRTGNKKAQDLILQYTEYIAVGLSNLIHHFNPPAVIIGGAVTEQGDILFKPIRTFVQKFTMDGFANRPDVPILPARLGNRAGIMGAAKLAIARSEA
ncbi:glucokinase [Paenibacillus sp. J45TS6]|uniref:ROK family protein n=1 Tax=unclassified Paenibacillus TaxID=185978 RepID=UPI001AFDA09B|nr:ROK family protein [Paenibacillus sp. J45TS6]GIP41820.1 glucokinase [Paenibacillus sp. J45TS6]